MSDIDSPLSEFLPKATLFDILFFPFERLVNTPEQWEMIFEELRKRKFKKIKLLILHFLVATPALGWPFLRPDSAPSKLIWPARTLLGLIAGVGLGLLAKHFVGPKAPSSLDQIALISILFIYYIPLLISGFETSKPWRNYKFK